MSTSGISIVIPAYNEEAYLPGTLGAINEARARFESATGLSSEMVVVNNASTDKTAEVALAHGAIVVDHHVRNISAVRNAGIHRSLHGLIVTIDADSLLPADGLVKIWEVMSDGRLIGGALGVTLITDKLSKKILAGIILTLAAYTSGINGAMFFFRKDDALAIGGFDENKLTAEDAAFAIALRRHGRKHGKKFTRLKTVKVATADRKDLSVRSIIPLISLAIRAFAGQKQTQEELGFWYKPKR